PNFDGYVLPVLFPACDPSAAEPLIVISTIYDSPLTGFDTDGDGQIDSPYSRTDADGDGILDEFAAGVIVTFANVDTDGDGQPDVLDVQGGGNFTLSAVDLNDGIVSFGSYPTGDADGDGDPDGGLEIFFAGGEGPDTDGDGFGDSGPIFNQFLPSSLSPSLFYWGTPDVDNSGCAAGFGITEGSSSGLLWAQTRDQCAPGTPDTSNIWDPATDLTDLTGLVPCPDPLTPSLVLRGVGVIERFPCADTNQNAVLDPGDFNAWVIAFNTQGFGCDQNGDDLCDPSDFNAWVVNFNSGAPCP
ncbi:MAG: hypothetical protein AAFY46_17080, partial [Planctomycetota bacterium]